MKENEEIVLVKSEIYPVSVMKKTSGVYRLWDTSMGANSITLTPKEAIALAKLILESEEEG